MSTFPIGSSVLLQGLVGAAQYNDKKGIVRSKINASGRQEVYVFEANKSMAIKPINMKYEPRDISTLSINEMKGLLLVAKKLNNEPDEWKGVNKDELQKMVATVADSPEEIAALVAKANEPKEIPSAAAKSQPAISKDQLRQGAERMSQMSPEALKQQAATMRAMGPTALRNMNPQMTHMTDAQINMAIDQMEAVANNPAMMKMAAEQMKNISPEELKAMKNDPVLKKMASPATSNLTTSTPVAAPTVNNISPDQFKFATQKMAGMTPEQLRAQTNMLKSLPMDTLRRTNPQMANMTDEQIRMSIAQMEQMAENPEMLKMAAEQMKDMTPEQFENMRKMMGSGFGAGATNVSSGGSSFESTNYSCSSAANNGLPSDPSQMMEALLSNPEQLKSMIKTMKANPEMMKQMVAVQMGGESAMNDAKREQMEKAIDQFANMDEVQLERYIKVATFAQTAAKPFLNAWNGSKRILGVSSKTLLVILNFTIIGSFVGLIIWYRSREESEDLQDVLASLEDDEPPEIIGREIDEF
eukprot:CAMPEP_0171344692 /NCGR_PEP_ID=MMETSP0878-20121228/19943_1 /TAXON_ID=67004 /ORGANISM="Thalassiosira weissflogii, Strain CCMP1336" /LENGTH=527 /DNA_ID=CAMNT_0011847941 /DNA_START=11 /DNA_END=1594 /DNA_ORIENTATION=+